MNYQKINRLWQSSTLFVAPILIVVLIWVYPNMDFYQWLLWLHLPLLMFHEAEEYVLSPLSFKEFFNLKGPMGSKTDKNYPLDEGYVFQVNILIAWPIVIFGAILAPVAPWIGFSMIWFELILNNLMHTIIFQREKPTYNPGLITNSFLLIPFAMCTLLSAINFFTVFDWVLSAVMGATIAALFVRKTRGRLKRVNSAEINERN